MAPINVINPCSTAPNRLSCCDFEKRWISSMKSMARPENMPDRLTEAMISRTSFTPLWMAESSWKGRSVWAARILAKVVLPLREAPKESWMADALLRAISAIRILLRPNAPGPNNHQAFEAACARPTESHACCSISRLSNVREFSGMESGRLCFHRL